MESNHFPPSIRVVLVEGAILSLKILLNYIDFILVLARNVYVSVLGSRSSQEQQQQQRNTTPRVVIVGASFGGLAVEHALAQYPNELQVTVIDYKDYFEYVPGALRCFIEPSHFKKGLSCPLWILQEVNHTQVITGQVVGVQAAAATSPSTLSTSHSTLSTTLTNQVILKDGRKIPFDYLVLAAGSTYPSPIKATPAQPTLPQRQEQWNASAQELKDAHTILIAGAGAVGVELAAEILTKYRATKRVLMVDTAHQILPGFHPSSVRYATQWLLRHGAELNLGSPVQRVDDHSVVWIDGKTVKVDLFYKCVGVAPNADFLKTSNNHGSSALLTAALTGPRGAVVVNDHLQVKGMEHIFCVGDLCFHESSNELKLGHTAEVNGHLVAENVLRSIRTSSTNTSSSDPLLSYPMGAVGNTVTPKIYDLSLGKYDATLAFNSLIIHGGVAAVVKWLLEWTKVAAAQQRPIGILFWIIADFVSNLLGRTLLPTPLSPPPSSEAAAAAKEKGQ